MDSYLKRRVNQSEREKLLSCGKNEFQNNWMNRGTMLVLQRHSRTELLAAATSASPTVCVATLTTSPTTTSTGSLEIAEVCPGTSTQAQTGITQMVPMVTTMVVISGHYRILYSCCDLALLVNFVFCCLTSHNSHLLLLVTLFSMKFA